MFCSMAIRMHHFISLLLAREPNNLSDVLVFYFTLSASTALLFACESFYIRTCVALRAPLVQKLEFNIFVEGYFHTL